MKESGKAVATALHGNVRIHYETYGSWIGRDTVVMLSGAGTDGSVWERQAAALQDDFFVVTVDNRGAGKSDCPAFCYNADMMAGDVAAVLDHVGIETVALVGFSLGGLVAQRFVNNYPRRVSRLVVMNCSLGGGNPETVLPRRDVVNMFLYSAALSGEDCCRNAMDYNFGERFKELEPRLYDRYFTETMRNYEGISWQIPVMVSDVPLIENYAAIRVPALWILSKDDPVIPPRNGDAVRKYLPHARVEYLDGYHASMLIHPERVNALLKSFLVEK